MFNFNLVDNRKKIAIGLVALVVFIGLVYYISAPGVDKLGAIESVSGLCTGDEPTTKLCNASVYQMLTKAGIIFGSVTYANRPTTCTAGTMIAMSDSDTCTATGGLGVICICDSNGTAWKKVASYGYGY